MRARAAVVLVVLPGLLGCSTKPTQASAPSASVSASASAVPPRPTTSTSVLDRVTSLTGEQVAAQLNPSKLPVYEGPFGTVVGRVRYKGRAPEPNEHLPPPKCEEARKFYEKTFRVSEDGALADAVVGVTEYPVFVPPVDEARVVRYERCAFDSRTITMTLGQRLDIVNLGDEIVLPRLHGMRQPALLAAVPNADPGQLFPTEPGRYLLVDEMAKRWLEADVFVFKYPTHTVTNAKGEFAISRVPVGKVKVSARHPKFPSGLAETHVQVDADKPTHVELLIDMSQAPPPPPKTKVQPPPIK